MLLHGIEVDRVAGRKLECFYTDVHLESSLNQVKQFHSRVKVWLDQVPRQRVKMRQVAVQLSVIYAEIEAFEVPGKVDRFRIGWKDLPLFAPCHCDDMPLSWDR